MKYFTYTAVEPIKIDGVVVKPGEHVVLDEQTGGELVEATLVVQASDEEAEAPSPVEQPKVRKVAAAKPKAAPKKTAR